MLDVGLPKDGVMEGQIGPPTAEGKTLGLELCKLDIVLALESGGELANVVRGDKVRQPTNEGGGVNIQGTSQHAPPARRSRVGEQSASYVPHVEHVKESGMKDRIIAARGFAPTAQQAVQLWISFKIGNVVYTRQASNF
jgi:hypothetical protein